MRNDRERELQQSMQALEQAAQTKPIEALDAKHVHDAPGGTIPVTWSDPATGRKLKGRPLTVVPTPDEVRRLGNARAATCGVCKYFDLEGGRKEIRRQRVLERVVHEEQWRPHHLGEVTEMGICRQRPTMATTYVSPACEVFKPRKG